MILKLEKIQKIANGILQHFTAMDKGFARVESDVRQLKKFRTICYDAGENLNRALTTFLKTTSSIQKRDSMVSAVIDKNQRQQMNDAMMQLRQVAGNNVEMIMDYIDQYPVSGKKSYSLEALLKFSNVIEQEFHSLEQEVNALKMEFILEDRKEQMLETIRVAEEENQNE